MNNLAAKTLTMYNHRTKRDYQAVKAIGKLRSAIVHLLASASLNSQIPGILKLRTVE
jgi:hypothetical protein